MGRGGSEGGEGDERRVSNVRQLSVQRQEMVCNQTRRVTASNHMGDELSDAAGRWHLPARGHHHDRPMQPRTNTKTCDG